MDHQHLFNLASKGCNESLGLLLVYFCEQRLPHIARRIPNKFSGLLDAQDILQQACVDAFASFSNCKFKDNDAMRGWFDTIARRNLIDAIRCLKSHKRGGQLTRLMATSHTSSISRLLSRLPIHSVTASRAAMATETFDRLAKAISQLPPHYREVIQRYELDGETIESIAERLGKTIGSIFMIRSRAIRTLGSMLDYLR